MRHHNLLSRALMMGPLSSGKIWAAHGAYGGGFDPASLFAASEQGAWYDPSDLSSMYQDAAGTTPAVVGQPVGRIEDQSGNGNHATQSTTASKPILSRVPFGGRRNLLTYTEEFDNAAWGKVSTTATAQGDGSFLLDFAAAAELQYNTGVNGVNHNARCEVKAWSGAGAATHTRLSSNDGAAWNTGVSSKVALTSEWQTIEISGDILPSSAGNVRLVLGTKTASGSSDADCIGKVLVRFPQLEEGSTATAYQKVVSQHDVTETGKADLYYLAFDGVDDFLVTGSINFTSTDEMSVFAGVRNIAEGAIGMVAELSPSSTSNNGSWGVWRNSVSNWFARSRGTVAADAQGGSLATAALTMNADISADSVVLRENSAQIGAAATDQGTGNFGNYPLYIGRRGGSSLPFNGNLYSLIVRGKLAAGDNLTKTEAYVADKTGVALA